MNDRRHTSTLANQHNKIDRGLKKVESRDSVIGSKEDAAAEEARELIDKAVAEIRDRDAEAGERVAAALKIGGGDGNGEESAEGKEQAGWTCAVS